MNLSREQCLQGLKRVAACAAVVLLASLLLLWQSHHRLTRQATTHLDLLLAQLADALQPMLVGNDRLAIQRTLDSLADGKAVIAIRVSSPSGAPLAAAGDTARPDALHLQRTLALEGEPLAQLELLADPATGHLPWLPLLLLAGGLGGLATLCYQGLRVLREQPPVLLTPEPESGLQWPAWLDSPQPQALLAIAIANYGSLHNSLSPAMLARHLVDTLDLLKTLPGAALVPIQPLGAGGFLLVFDSLAAAADAACQLAQELPPLNRARKAEGALALRLQASLFGEPEGNEMATADRRWLALQQQGLALLDMGSLCEENEILLERDTAEALRALRPAVALTAIAGEDSAARAWRWQAA